MEHHGGLVGSGHDATSAGQENVPESASDQSRKRPAVEDEEENPWRKAARIRWEKHRQAQALGLVVTSTAGKKPKKEEESEDEGPTFGLDGAELESFKTMCTSVFARCNKLTGPRRKRIERFLAGRYDVTATGKEEITLNEEKTVHSEIGEAIREVISFEMDYGMRQWRKLKRRWRLESPSDVKKDGSDSAE